MRPYVLLPADYKKKQGRPSKALTEAREAALAAAEDYEQQRDGGGSGSPAKRPRLAQAGAAGAAAGKQQQQKQQQLEVPAASIYGAPSNGALASPSSKQQRLQQASPTATQVRRADLGREAATPLGRSSKPGAGQKLRRPGGEQQQQEEAADTGAGDDPPQQQQEQEAAADPAGSERQQAQADATAAAVHTAQQPTRPAVTELGLGTFASLAPVPEQQQQQQHKRRPSGGAAGDAGSSRRHPQSRPSINKHQQQERPRSRGGEAAHAGQRAQGAVPAQAGEQEGAEQEGAEQEEGPVVPAEPTPERPGDIACRRFAALLPGLTLMRESISAAAAAAISAGE